MACRLYCVSVKQYAFLPADRTNLLDWLNCADLIVGIHHRHETGIVTNGLCHLLRQDDAVFVHIQKCDFKALFFQLLQRVQNSMVLKGGGNDVLLAASLSQPRSRQDRLIVRLAAAGGEGDFFRGSAYACRDSLPRVCQCFSGHLSGRMEA